jgi:hypothetical protein
MNHERGGDQTEIEQFARSIEVLLHSVDASRTDIGTYDVIYPDPYGRYPDLHIDVTAFREAESEDDTNANEVINGEFSVYEGAADEPPLHSLSFTFDREGFLQASHDGTQYEEDDVARWIAIESALVLCGLVDARHQDGTPVVSAERVRSALRSIHAVLDGDYRQVFESNKGKEIFALDDREKVAKALVEVPGFLIHYFQGDPVAASVINYTYNRSMPGLGEVLIGQSIETIGSVQQQQTHIGVSEAAREMFEGEPIVVRRVKLVEIQDGQAKLLTRDVDFVSPDDQELQMRYYAAHSSAKKRAEEAEGQPLNTSDLEFFRTVFQALQQAIENEKKD